MQQEQEDLEDRQQAPQSLPSSQVQPQPAHEVKNCIVCGEDIKKSAKKCIHCDSLQNWQRHFAMSHIVLSLLVALLSVSSIAVPAIIKAFTPRNSHLAFTYLSSDNNRIAILAFNSGTRPGVVTEATILMEGATHPLTVSGSPSVIEPEKTQQIVLGTDEISKYFYTALEILSSAVGHPSKSSSCQIDIRAIEFNGSKKMASFVRPCQELLHQADR